MVRLCLTKDDENVMVKALKFEVSGSRGRRRPKQTWKKEVENKIKWSRERDCMRSNEIAKRGRDIDHTKSGQLRRQGYHRIKTELIMMIIQR